jgi:hypothetical protein
MARLPASYALPTQPGREMALHAVCSSVSRVLRAGIAMLDYNGGTDARQPRCRRTRSGRCRTGGAAPTTSPRFRSWSATYTAPTATTATTAASGKRRRMFDVTAGQRDAWAEVQRLSGAAVAAEGGGDTSKKGARGTDPQGPGPAAADDGRPPDVAVLAFLAELLSIRCPSVSSTPPSSPSAPCSPGTPRRGRGAR